MKKQQKVRNLRAEQRYAILCNVIVILVALAAAMAAMPQSERIGMRNMFAMYAIDGTLTFCLMVLFEKYAITTTDLYENFLITLLSCLYTYILLTVANFILFASLPKLIMDTLVFAVKLIGVFLTDVVLKCNFNNEKRYRKPRMLIMDSSDDNYARLKRIKYGVIKNYTPWYESVADFTPEQMEAFVQEKFTDYEAVCLLDGMSDEIYHKAVAKATDMNMDLFIVPKIIDVGKTNALRVCLNDILTLYMPKRQLSGIELGIKRIGDIFLGVIGLILACIPMAVIALAIKLTSPGPVFYKQLRLTKDKKEFYIYKFRTMIPDAEKVSGPKFAEKDDPRITPIGKILRACRLDELPQILNILKGDMSVVGPRPERPVFVEQFEKEIENYDYRFAVKAGLTSLSHIYGRYSTYIHDRTYYDLFYITHYSLFLDIKIILLTSKTMFLKSAAEGEDDYKEKTVAGTMDAPKEKAEVNTH